jgi:hypothetical protein
MRLLRAPAIPAPGPYPFLITPEYAEEASEGRPSRVAVANTWLSAPPVLCCPACWHAAPDLAVTLYGLSEP